MATTETAAIYSDYGADEDLSELVEIFVSEIPQRIAKLTESFESRNMEELRRTAHQLKGAGGSYGFVDLSPTAAALEFAVRDQEPEETISDKYQKLVDMCQRLRPGAPE